MRETVSNNTSIECYEVPLESIWQVLRWIHFDLSESDFSALLADVQPRFLTSQELMPLEVVENGVRIAAAYFLQLSGNVATLGGLRAKRESEPQASLVMQEFQRRLSEKGIAQIQALIGVNNVSSRMVMLHSPFRQVTTVRHLWLDLLSINHTAIIQTAEKSIEGYSCLPASQLDRVKIDSLVEATFTGTLDCPDLDGVRNPSDVVSGFLESRSLDADLPWFILCDENKPIGCALVNSHPHGIFELAYVGLIPERRGLGLGRALVEYAIHHCLGLGGNYFTTAVDTANWPACKIYDSLGFSEIRELAVWLPKVDKSQRIVAA